MSCTTSAGAEGERHHLRAVARGSAVTLAGALLSTIAGFGLVLVVTRNVSPETAGTFFTVSSVFLVALAASGLGTDTGLARFVLRNDAPSAVRSLTRTAVVPVLIVSCALALPLAVWWPDARPLVWALPLAALADLCLAAVRAHAHFRASVLIDRIARPGVQIVLVAVVVATGRPGAVLAAAWACGYVVSAVLSVRALAALLTGRERSPVVEGAGEPSSVVQPRAFWAYTWPRAVARIAQVSVQKLDIVLVAWLLSPKDAALYTVATRFVVFGQLANQAVSSVVQPRFTMILAGHDDDRALLTRVFGVTACWSVLLAWPVYLCVAAAPLSYLGWFGPAYVTDQAVVVALVMAAGMLIAVASGPVDTLLLMIGRSGRSLANTLIALAVDLGLCLVLVPRIGIAGAGVAWVVAVVVRCALAVAQLRADLDLSPRFGDLALAAALPVLCMACPVAVLALVVGLTPTTWLLASVVSGLGYAAVVWRLRERLAVDVFVSGLRTRRQELVPA